MLQIFARLFSLLFFFFKRKEFITSNIGQGLDRCKKNVLNGPYINFFSCSTVLCAT